MTINTCHDLNIQETLLGKEDDGSINNNNKKRLIPPFVAKETKRALVSAAQESKVDWIRQTYFGDANGSLAAEHVGIIASKDAREEMEPPPPPPPPR